MSDEYRELGEVSREHERCRAEASTSPAVAKLEAWHGYAWDGNWISGEDDIRSFSLPLPGGFVVLHGYCCGLNRNIDASYRQSIVKHQEKSALVAAWHNTTLSVRQSLHILGMSI
jgi:hypothetical protein